MSPCEQWQDKEAARRCYENGWLRSLLDRVRKAAIDRDVPEIAEDIDHSLRALEHALKEREASK